MTLNKVQRTIEQMINGNLTNHQPQNNKSHHMKSYIKEI